METMMYFNMVLAIAVYTDVFPSDLTEILKGKAEFCALFGPPTFGLGKTSRNALCLSEITISALGKDIKLSSPTLLPSVQPL